MRTASFLGFFTSGRRSVLLKVPIYCYPAVSYREPPVLRYVQTEPDKKRDLDGLRQNIEEKGIARQHGDTLKKRGISVDGLLNPSSVKDLKNIQYYGRVSLYPGRPRR